MEMSVHGGPHFDVVRYSGSHDCEDADHDLDRQVREYLANRVSGGRARFLLDVRDLEVTFPSGLSDLFDSWGPALKEDGVRIVVLWRGPTPGRGNRFAHMKQMLEDALRKSGRDRLLPSELGFFVDEDEAEGFLEDRTRPTKSQSGE
jgi:hypothetical protein